MGKEMENMKNNVVEKNLNPASGMLMLILSIVGILAGVFLIIAGIWASSSSSGMAAVLITAGVLLMILCFIWTLTHRIRRPWHTTINRQGYAGKRWKNMPDVSDR